MVGKPGGLVQAACSCSDEVGCSEGELSNRSPPLSDFTDDPGAVFWASTSHCSASLLWLLPAPHTSSERVIPRQAGTLLPHRCSGSDSLWAVPAPTRQLAMQGLHLCLPVTGESKQFPLLSQDLRPLADNAEGKCGFGFNSGHKLSGLLPGPWGTEVTCGALSSVLAQGQLEDNRLISILHLLPGHSVILSHTTQGSRGWYQIL